MSAVEGITLILQPRDGLIARDARPFDPTPGARAATLDWPWPQTIAGALRTRIGNDAGFNWDDPDGPRRAQAIEIAGPLLAARHAPDAGWLVYVSAPRDAVAYRDDDDNRHVMRLLPDLLADGERVDLPHPLLRPLAITEDVKPETG
ncbi:MAG: type III-B CRISPR module-associated Cmr3 family protein, partial [Vicinamibacterales bacterium]